MGYGSKQKEIRVGKGESQMSDYLHAKTENVQKLLDNCLKKQKQELIGEFVKIGDRIIEQIRMRYGRDSKGSEFLVRIFKDEIKKLKEGALD